MHENATSEDSSQVSATAIGLASTLASPWGNSASLHHHPRRHRGLLLVSDLRGDTSTTVSKDLERAGDEGQHGGTRTICLRIRDRKLDISVLDPGSWPRCAPRQSNNMPPYLQHGSGQPQVILSDTISMRSYHRYEELPFFGPPDPPGWPMHKTFFLGGFLFPPLWLAGALVPVRDMEDNCQCQSFSF